MRILGMLKTNLDDWLQRHHKGVALACLIVVAFTMFLRVSFFHFQHDLIYWRNLVMDPHYLMLSMVLGVPFRLGYQLAVRFFPTQWQESLVEQLRRRQFADFIVRRLLHQLDLASRKLPERGKVLDLTDPATQQRFEQVQMAAYRAVQLFRQDANAVLYQQPPEPTEESRYIVLDEEEQALRQNGFVRLDMLVTDKLLRQLLSPCGERPSSS